MRSARFEAPADKVRRLGALQAERKRQLEELAAAGASRWGTPGELAAVVDSSTVQTAALDLIDRELVEAYTSRDARLIVTMPPQEGKSTRVTKVGSLWALIRNPDLRIGICSYAQSLAETFGRDVRTWISSFQGAEGTVDLGLRIARDYGSVRRWKLDGHRGGVVCVGIGSGLTGRPLDALVIDDPLADQTQADSLYFRERVWSWWQSVGAPRLAPGSPVIVILTRWHEDDLAGRLQAAEDGHRWKVVNIPALADHDPAKGQSDALGREPGEWLESARGRTPEDWERIRIQSGTRVFTALYQGAPSPEQGNVWQRQWWRRYAALMWSQHPAVADAWLVHGVDQVLISVDATFKDTRSSDFVVMQVWARRGAQAFLLDMVRKRLSFTDTVKALRALVRQWPQAGAKLVEDKANGQAVIDSLRFEIPGIVPVTPRESKYARANAVSPFIEAGNVFLPEKELVLWEPGELVEEAAAFPNAAHDDMVDATSQALAEMFLDGTGAEAWLRWAKAKAEEIAERRLAGELTVADAPTLPEAPAVRGAELVREVLHAWPGPWHKCGKPDCTRLVSLGSVYCCTPCTAAADGGYEIHAHSPECDERAAVRKADDGVVEPAAILSPDDARRRARNEAFQAAGGDGQWRPKI